MAEGETLGSVLRFEENSCVLGRQAFENGMAVTVTKKVY